MTGAGVGVGGDNDGKLPLSDDAGAEELRRGDGEGGPGGGWRGGVAGGRILVHSPTSRPAAAMIDVNGYTSIYALQTYHLTLG